MHKNIERSENPHILLELRHYPKLLNLIKIMNILMEDDEKQLNKITFARCGVNRIRRTQIDILGSWNSKSRSSIIRFKPSSNNNPVSVAQGMDAFCHWIRTAIGTRQCCSQGIVEQDSSRSTIVHSGTASRRSVSGRDRSAHCCCCHLCRSRAPGRFDSSILY